MPSPLRRLFGSSWAPLAISPIILVLGALGLAIWALAGEETQSDQVEAIETVTLSPPQPESAVPTPTSTFRLASLPTPPRAAVEPTPEEVSGPVSPLNGLPVAETSTRRVLAVKIDNAANARPQSGIEQADMMVEIWVEGITRFLSLWQSSDSDYVGPIRSMRPTDFAIQNPLATTFVNSGGQPWIQAIGNASSVRWFSEPSGSFRIGSRYAPHNLYGDTTALRPLDSRGDYAAPLDPLWTFGPMPDGSAEATEIVTSWPAGYTVGWSWDGSAYARTTQGQAHEYLDPDGRAHQVTAETLVMLEMPIYTASGSSGSAVPASQSTGSGTAWVFADGRVLAGEWQRDADTEWFRLSTADGDELTVPPGQLWLILPPPGGVTVSS